MTDKEDTGLVQLRQAEIVRAKGGGDDLLARIRPEWQSKNLITRVKRLLNVDPSSACQRLLNAAIHDLREKIVIAGLDLAQESAGRFKLPSISKSEDVTEGYSVTRVIDLAYRMGILSRPEWRRVKRCYEIRRDLEHEDDQYEAEVEDVLYIFKVCVEVVLSRDPIALIKVEDVKALIDAPSSPVVSEEILEEFEKAPAARQKEIVEHLINTSLNDKKPDVIRQNAIEVLRLFRPVLRNESAIELGQELQERLQRKPLDLSTAKVAHAAGILPYLKQKKLEEFFASLVQKFKKVGHRWTEYQTHPALMDELEDVGGLEKCPPKARAELVLWLVRCYIGEAGEYGTFGRNRKVFYSDAVAGRIHEMLNKAGNAISGDFAKAKRDHLVSSAANNVHVARRLATLEDLIENE